MNIRFSGDTRDLFKFDLVRHLMKSFPELLSFTFIPMLTDQAEPSKQKKSATTDLLKAAKAGKAGSQNRSLMEHMGKLQEIEDDMDYFTGIESYFRQENILVDVLQKDRFSHEHRANYFGKLFEQFPKRSLVFLDPDTGLEVKNPTRRHLLFEEVKKIADHMDTQSILMIYQHFPREIRDGYIRSRCSQLSTHRYTTRLHNGQRDRLLPPGQRTGKSGTGSSISWQTTPIRIPCSVRAQMSEG